MKILNEFSFCVVFRYFYPMNTTYISDYYIPGKHPLVKAYPCAFILSVCFEPLVLVLLIIEPA